jgi:1-acyl-sn-glycerol-3-phosphate acyltransferase
MNRLVSWLCKIFLGPIIKLLFIKEIRGVSNIPKTNFILTTNHQSHIDELVAGYVCLPRRFHFIGQVDSYSGLTKLLRDMLYFVAGVIPINRNDNESKKQALAQAIKVLKEGDIIIIYPEGTRTRTGEIGKGKTGAARIFLESGVPILPLAIEGTFDLMPPGSKPKIKKIIKMNIGKPLYFKNEYLAGKNISEDTQQYNQLLMSITNSLMQEITRLKSEIN